MSRGPVLLSSQNAGTQKRFRAEPLVNGRQDFRRVGAKELAFFQQALGHREDFPVNMWDCGDSMTECFGVTDDYKKWPYLKGRAVQDRFRNGGIGYIPSRHTRGVTWPYSSNPDGKNTWAYTGTRADDVTDFGFGFGRRSVWHNNAATQTITVDCDRFWIVYTTLTTASSITIDIDAGTAFAQSFTQSTQGSPAETFSGRIWDSATAGATLTLGTHTVKVTSTTLTNVIDGIMVFYTDAITGIHTFEGGLSGAVSADFDGTDAAGGDGAWSDIAYQPHTPAGFTDGVGNGTTTFTSATAAFTDNDIGEYIVWSMGQSYKPLNGVARIVARASGTSVTLDRTVPSASSQKFRINRAQFTDGVITNGSKTMTSATAAFTQWDVNRFVQGPAGIQAGTYIARYNSATSVELSQAATASASSQTVRVLGRQRFWCAPELITWEFGINDRNTGVPVETYKANVRRGVALASERAAIGFPVGYAQRYVPSVLLLGMWAVGSAAISNGRVTATSGSAIITSDSDSTANGYDFDPADVGKTITTTGNTPIPASTTILSVQSNRQATLSQNAVASTTATANIVSRAPQDKHWQPFRNAMFELASENSWRFFDLYSLGGWIGTTDPYNLTSDLVHSNNHGSKWVADEFDIVIAGQPRSAAIPQGIFDNKGEVVLGAGVDTAGKILPGIDGQTLTGASSATYGGLFMDAAAAASIAQFVPSTAGAGASLVTGMVAPTGTATTVDDNWGQWLNYATSTVAFNANGPVWAYTHTRPGRLPEFFARVRLDASLVTLVQYCIGLTSASTATLTPGNPPAAAVQGAYFRYNTIGDGTAFWRTVTSDGTTRNVQITTQPVVADFVYRLRIEVRGIVGTSVSGVYFYINDLHVSTHITNLPAVGQALGPEARVETLTAAVRNLKISRLSIAGP